MTVLSARALDRLAGLRAGHVAMIESGARDNIESKTAEGLSRVLGVSLDWLLLGKGDEPTIDAVARAVAKADRSGKAA